jgi:type IV secretion system protein VirB10
MSDRPPVEGERTVSEVASTRRPLLTRGQMVLAGTLMTGAIIALVFWKTPTHRADEEEKTAPARLAAPIPYEAPKAVSMPPVIPALLQTPSPSTAAPLPPPTPSVTQRVEALVASSKPEARPAMLSYNVAPPPDAPKPVAANGAQGKGESAGTRVVYQGAVVAGGKAGTMPDRNLVLMPGLVRCTLSTAINSDLAGPFTCVIPGDVLSPTGVVLMDKGTIVVGSYDSHVRRGQKRVLTVSATAYTPNGVVVPLGGPMSDALGRTGLEGEEDAHLWERFSGAVLLSLVENAFSLAQASLSKGNSTYLNLQTGGVGSLAQEVLRDTINIPTTITVNQGSDVALWITTPIDFSASYKLEPTH